jgi:hypothetical protein
MNVFRLRLMRIASNNIRNAINHGEIDAGNPEELLRIEDKQTRLWMIVFGILGQLISVPRPLDTAR